VSIKNLYSYGFIFKIKQYDDFIKTIKRYIKRDISINITKENFQNKLEFMFEDKIPTIEFLFSEEHLKYISVDYFEEIVETGYLDLYMEEKYSSFDKELHKEAYKRIFIEFIYKKGTNINQFFEIALRKIYPEYWKDNIKNAKIIKIINEGVDIPREERKDIMRTVIHSFQEYTINLLVENYLTNFNNRFFYNEEEILKRELKSRLFPKNFIWNKKWSVPSIDRHHFSNELIISVNSDFYSLNKTVSVLDEVSFKIEKENC